MSDPTREALIGRFLAANGFAAGDASPLAQDAGFRRYLRLRGGAVLMDAPPPEDIRPFLSLAAHLAALGLSAPRILAADEANGLVIEEDLGDDLYSVLWDAPSRHPPAFPPLRHPPAPLPRHPPACPGDLPPHGADPGPPDKPGDDGGG